MYGLLRGLDRLPGSLSHRPSRLSLTMDMNNLSNIIVVAVVIVTVTVTIVAVHMIVNKTIISVTAEIT